MMSTVFLETFKFRKESNLIYNLDPRTKIFILICYSILSLMFSNFFILLILFLTLLQFFGLARNFKRLLSFNKNLSIMIFFVFIINIFFFDLDFAFAMIIRLLILMDSFLLFFTTMHPDELAQSLSKMKIPFIYAYSISLATRFVPTLSEEAQKIRHAQMARGIDLQAGSMFQQIKNYIPLLIPLFVSSIRKAHIVAESLESRGFNAHIKRTFLYEVKLRRADYILLIIFAQMLVIGIIFAFGYSYYIPTLTQLVSIFLPL